MVRCSASCGVILWVWDMACLAFSWLVFWDWMKDGSVRRMIGEGELEAKGNEHGAGRAVKPMHAALHGIAPRHPGSGQSPARVDRDGVQVEQHTQQYKGQRLVLGARRNELRHKSQEKNRHLGIEHIGPEAAQKNRLERLGNFGRSHRDMVGAGLRR